MAHSHISMLQTQFCQSKVKDKEEVFVFFKVLLSFTSEVRGESHLNVEGPALQLH